MRRRIKRSLIWIAIGAAICVAAFQKSGMKTKEEDAIRRAVANLQQAWNSHDPKSMGPDLTEDADLVIPPGNYLSGKTRIQAGVEESLPALQNAQIVYTVDHIRFLKPDVALVDSRFEILGSTLPKEEGLTTLVMTNQGGRWLLAAQRLMIPVQRPESRQASARLPRSFTASYDVRRN